MPTVIGRPLEVWPRAGRHARKEIFPDLARRPSEYPRRRPGWDDLNRSFRKRSEVPGFYWFNSGPFGGPSFSVGGETAGASLLGRNGTVSRRDRDGPGVNPAEITRCTSGNPGERFPERTPRFGSQRYIGTNSPAIPEPKESQERLSPEANRTSILAGDALTARLTLASANGTPRDCSNWVASPGWCVARPSGTDNLFERYAESAQPEEPLHAFINHARETRTRAPAS
jgi:phosphoglucomutase